MFLGVLLARQIGLDVGGGAVVLPLLATQILWINLVTDGPPALALGVDPADEGLMHQPPRPVGEGVVTGRMWRGIFVGYRHGGRHAVRPGRLNARVRRGRRQPAVWTDDGVHNADVVSDLQRGERAIRRAKCVRSPLHEPMAVGAVAGSVALQVLVVYVPFLQRAFGHVGLTARDWMFCIAVASSVLWLRKERS